MHFPYGISDFAKIICADQFSELFGGLAIGQHPTPLHNQYLILRWDFSLSKVQGEIADIEVV